MDQEPRFRFIGDHSAEHCGCAAVTEVILDSIEPYGRVAGPKDEFDALIVNGEGSMHHGKRNFLSKMHEIRKAQIAGKPTFLINTLWQDNPRGYDDCLKKMDDFWVRGAASARDLEKRHGISVQHFIDLSYFAKIDETAPFKSMNGAIAATDVYAEGFGFVWLSAKRTGGWTNVDMRKMSWSSFVKTVSTAKLLVSGRHHGVYAACRARVPFVPIRGNSHKLEDLLATANSTIPIADSVFDAINLVKWAAANPSAYEDLFDWMDEQPRWTFDPSANRPMTRVKALPAPEAKLSVAKKAVFCRNFDDAYPLWKQLLNERGEKLPYPRYAAMAFFGAGDVPLGMTVLSKSRLAKPKSIIFLKTLMTYARHQTIWIEREGHEDWWAMAREAAFQIQTNNDSRWLELAHKALRLALDEQGPVFASSVRFLLCCKLVQLNHHRDAFELMRSASFTGVPEWIELQEDILVNALCRRFDESAQQALLQSNELECWADPAFRAIVLRHRLMLEGPCEAIISFAKSCHKRFPQHGELRDLYYSVLGEANQLDALFGTQPQKSVDQLQTASLQHLPLAHYIVTRGLAQSGALQLRCDLWEKLINGKDELISKLSDPSLSIAVVGNSPIELGKGKGDEIDAHDLVIRFNDFNTDPPFDVDYGTRTDILFHTYALESDSGAQIRGSDALLVQRHAFNVFEPRDWSAVIELSHAHPRLAFLPRQAFIDAAKHLGSTPSAGLVVVFYLKALRGHVDRKSCFGFSFTDQLSGARKAHYFNDERPSLIHDWEREAAVFETLFSN